MPGTETELLPNEHQRSQKNLCSQYLQASNRFLVKSNDIFCFLCKEKKKQDEESHMLKITWKHTPPPCLKNFISLFIPFPFFFSQNCIILHFQHHATCGADAFLVFFSTLKNWQPKHSAQETNTLLEKNYTRPVNRNKSKERQAISFFSSKSQGTSPC